MDIMIIEEWSWWCYRGFVYISGSKVMMIKVLVNKRILGFC